jgi:hypothetical protein
MKRHFLGERDYFIIDRMPQNCIMESVGTPMKAVDTGVLLFLLRGGVENER